MVVPTTAAKGSRLIGPCHVSTKAAVKKTIRFDVVVSFEIDHEEALSILQQEVQALYPDYELQIVIDVDAAD